ncbi:hypothetical protein [Pseudomonas delhiensis]|uniref:hypothetical protein n=1 Tax=Pseudomonas delhiensis TaxID=366289 RepID=UPI00315A775F
MNLAAKVTGILSTALLLSACQSGPPPAPKTEVATQQFTLTKWLQVSFCTDGSNTIGDRLVHGRLCSKTQKYDVFGGPVIELAGAQGFVGSLSLQDATKGYSVMDGGITYTLKCEPLPKREANADGTIGDSYHCAFDANELPLIRVDITYPS